MRWILTCRPFLITLHWPQPFLYPPSGKHRSCRPRVHHPEPAAVSYSRGRGCEDRCKGALPCGKRSAPWTPHQFRAVTTSLHLLLWVSCDNIWKTSDYVYSNSVSLLLFHTSRLTEILSNASNGDQVKRVLNPHLREFWIITLTFLFLSFSMSFLNSFWHVDAHVWCLFQPPLQPMELRW